MSVLNGDDDAGHVVGFLGFTGEAVHFLNEAVGYSSCRESILTPLSAKSLQQAIYEAWPERTAKRARLKRQEPNDIGHSLLTPFARGAHRCRRRGCPGCRCREPLTAPSQPCRRSRRPDRCGWILWQDHGGPYSQNCHNSLHSTSPHTTPTRFRACHTTPTGSVTSSLLVGRTAILHSRHYPETTHEARAGFDRYRTTTSSLFPLGTHIPTRPPLVTYTVPRPLPVIPLVWDRSRGRSSQRQSVVS